MVSGLLGTLRILRLLLIECIQGLILVGFLRLYQAVESLLTSQQLAHRNPPFLFWPLAVSQRLKVLYYFVVVLLKYLYSSIRAIRALVLQAQTCAILICPNSLRPAVNLWLALLEVHIKRIDDMGRRGNLVNFWRTFSVILLFISRPVPIDYLNLRAGVNAMTSLGNQFA